MPPRYTRICPSSCRIFSECHASGSSSRSSSRSSADPIAAADAIHRELLPHEVELDRVVIHRILILPHQACGAPAAVALRRTDTLDIRDTARRKESATAKPSAATACLGARARARCLRAGRVHRSAAASRPAAVTNPCGGAPILSSSNVRTTTLCAAARPPGRTATTPAAAWRLTSNCSPIT